MDWLPAPFLGYEKFYYIICRVLECGSASPQTALWGLGRLPRTKIRTQDLDRFTAMHPSGQQQKIYQKQKEPLWKYLKVLSSCSLLASETGYPAAGQLATLAGQLARSNNRVQVQHRAKAEDRALMQKGHNLYCR